MKDVVKQGVNGIKVQSEDSKEYVMELEKLLSSDALLSTSLMGCRYVWENFQWDKVAEQYIKYLTEVNAV
jgi:glycosyltransferase involved in cell wall biosynthesis